VAIIVPITDRCCFRSPFQFRCRNDFVAAPPDRASFLNRCNNFATDTKK